VSFGVSYLMLFGERLGALDEVVRPCDRIATVTAVAQGM
jgi:hypothetical protein